MPQTINAQITGYGWPDNDPAGAAIAFPGEALHDQAGGTGTYQDPITFAGDPADTPVGTMIYVPTVQKYFVMEDTCESAMASKSDPVWVDLWVGGSGSDDVNAIYDAESAITSSSAQIIVDPDPGLPVSLAPLFGGANLAQLQSSLSGTSGSEQLIGGIGADEISAYAGDDIVQGGQGTDSLFGNEGNDVLFGNQGADVLYGGQGNDTLYGGQDNDILNGGLGDDVLMGNLGSDLFVFDTNQGNDIVLDFSFAEGDRLGLNGQAYQLGVAGDGSAQLLLAGGGSITMEGVGAGEFSGDYVV